MTENDTQRLAREWAENIDPLLLNERARAAIEHVLATTTPMTMADTVWDDEEHHLAGATTPSGIEVVMLWLNTGINRIVTDDALYARDMLTPNGKRYELREVGAPEQPAHPETLETLEDYENAPYGTIVDIDGIVAVRGWAGWYLVNFVGTRQPEFMFHQGEGDVIRWGGWGK